MRIAIAGIEPKIIHRIAHKMHKHDFIHIERDTFRGIHKGSPELIITTGSCGHQLSERIRAQLPNVPTVFCPHSGQSSTMAFIQHILEHGHRSLNPNHFPRSSG